MSNKHERRLRTAHEIQKKNIIQFGLMALAFIAYGIADKLEFHNIFRETPPQWANFDSSFSNHELDILARVANDYEARYSPCPWNLKIEVSLDGIAEDGSRFLGLTVPGSVRTIEIFSDPNGQGDESVFAHELHHGCAPEVIQLDNQIIIYSPFGDETFMKIKFIKGFQPYITRTDAFGTIISEMWEKNIEEFVIEVMIVRDGYEPSKDSKYIAGRETFEPLLASIPNTELEIMLRTGQLFNLANMMFHHQTVEENMKALLNIVANIY